MSLRSNIGDQTSKFKTVNLITSLVLKNKHEVGAVFRKFYFF